MADRFCKRSFDIAASALGLILLSPLLVCISVLIYASSGRPIFYGGARVGRSKHHFRMWKFRTMVPNADKMGASVTVENDRRITRIGRVLRATKMDELPGLFNVLIGDMSLVGPRPESPDWVAHYTADMDEVLACRPGVTDVAQVIFRHEEKMLAGSELNPSQYLIIMRWKVALQAAYQRQRTFLSDLRVVVWTIIAVFGRQIDEELQKAVSEARIGKDDFPSVLQERFRRIVGTDAAVVPIDH